ncbi:MAG: DUF5320 domain-containing protein [Anaerolineales bacterium]|nr:DUF5320 domain-containing protein [Anaerolineales bacterium]
MPRMDGTGPFGTGPVGRGLGPCGGGRAGQFYRGWGGGFRRGGGFGWNAVNAPFWPDDIQYLEQQKSWLESQLQAINTRIANLSQSSDSES